MADNKMLEAYRYLLEKAKEELIKADMKTWELLGQAVENIEEKESILEELTDEEMEQVRKDLKADLEAVAENLSEYQQGVENFLEMELPILESYLEEKALSLADPTDLMLLRLRMNAAMHKGH
ncbi:MULTISPECIES: hypothetical protein [Hydrogenovibrio]|uniref:Zinc ribbon-containing protein n=1 Tax=Hydrogenovibrio marinus TaxID=28885 RepID=A0A066ZW23_HYDMR|nr:MULTISPECIES: hypothetical protein [Hydrogenovibrio]KDN96484.1 hypothetical protein EI16_09485 [Hydrogenovibrio marinus]MBN2605808.1 hypothetical protein [Thiotrichales bacterium]MPQ76788.1 zinc ribbon-containing protein [Hydrogenovibrio sp. JE_KL2]BBN60317.1 hypothetical protein HVMH_1911 [Hydrogenovibrio marinus]